MKTLLSVFILILTASSLQSQQLISLNNETYDIEFRTFYIKDVIDKRQNQKYIGESWKGAFKASDKIYMDGGVENSFKNYLTQNFSKTSDNQIETDVYINFLEIKHSESYSKEIGEAYVILEFRTDRIKPFVAKAEIKEETNDVFSTHEERIRRGIKECVRQFNNSVYEAVNSGETKDEDALEITFNDKNNVKPEKYSDPYERPADRNIIAIGYQIGGITLIGLDYEVRVHDYLGIHFGGGFLGYTGGIKIHTNPKTNGLFFNLSWKDGGLGQVNGLGIEAGGRWVWIKSKDFGLIYQGGFFVINHMSEELQNAVYGNSTPPPVMFLIGVGLSW